MEFFNIFTVRLLLKAFIIVLENMSFCNFCIRNIGTSTEHQKSSMALSIENKQEKMNDETGQVSGDF